MHALGLRIGALAILFCAGAACAHATADGSMGGAGGEDESGPATTGHGASSTHATTGVTSSTTTNGNTTTTAVGTTGTSTATSGPSTTTGTSSGGCDGLDCGSCQNCALAPGGPCEPEWNACNANSECIGLLDCMSACPVDDPSTVANEELDCICSNDGNNCDGNLTTGTCFGDHSAGMNDYSLVGDCIFNTACPSSCF